MSARFPRLRQVALGLFVTLTVSACGGGEYRPRPASEAAPQGAGAPPPAATAEGDVAKAAPEARQGLGTEWGEKLLSRMTQVPFERAEAARPFAIAALYYNDAAGVDAATSGQKRVSTSAVSISGGVVTLQLKDERGMVLSGVQSGDKNYVIGESGKRYSIVLRNGTASRIETVVSVDGLDVINGKAASFVNRGYLLDPRSEIEIDGFRTSTDAVAAFRFGAVKDSYVEKKTGDARNVGVIGVAVFHEKGHGIPALLNAAELQKRNEANPFPGQFATPP